MHEHLNVVLILYYILWTFSVIMFGRACLNLYTLYTILYTVLSLDAIHNFSTKTPL